MSGSSAIGSYSARAFLVAFLVSISAARPVCAGSCSDTGDCESGETCAADTANPVFVEECFLWVFCDSYTLYPLVCQPASEEAPEPEPDEEIVIACINDIAVVRGLCILLRYFIDPDSIGDVWQELADTWVFGRRADE